MATCWHCEHQLTGRWQRRCTACGELLCWRCGHALDDPTRKYCIDCGAELAQPAPLVDAASGGRTRGSPGLLLAAAAAVVAVAVVVIAFVVGRDDESPTSEVDAYPTISAGIDLPTTTSTAILRTTTTTTPPLTGPAAIVRNYFDAITHRDYSTAWNLGGRNFEPNFDRFVADLESTANDTVTIDSVVGNQVNIRLDALQSDGSHRYFEGYYVVEGNELVSARIHRVY